VHSETLTKCPTQSHGVKGFISVVKVQKCFQQNPFVIEGRNTNKSQPRDHGYGGLRGCYGGRSEARVTQAGAK
jgi:hypothetical protein